MVAAPSQLLLFLALPGVQAQRNWFLKIFHISISPNAPCHVAFYLSAEHLGQKTYNKIQCPASRGRPVCRATRYQGQVNVKVSRRETPQQRPGKKEPHIVGFLLSPQITIKISLPHPHATSHWLPLGIRWLACGKLPQVLD